MCKQLALNELKQLFMTIIEDGVVTPTEVNYMQDWIDNNAVLFVGEEYSKIIMPIQNFIDDGVLSEQEIKKIFTLIEQL